MKKALWFLMTSAILAIMVGTASATPIVTGYTIIGSSSDLVYARIDWAVLDSSHEIDSGGWVTGPDGDQVGDQVTVYQSDAGGSVPTGEKWYLYVVYNLGGTMRTITTFNIDDEYGFGPGIWEQHDIPDAYDPITHISDAEDASLMYYSPSALPYWAADWDGDPIDIGNRSYLFVLKVSDTSVPGYVTGKVKDGSETLEGKVIGPTPEPATLFLLGAGIAGMAGAVMRRRRRK